jgi:hypothetical protein
MKRADELGMVVILGYFYIGQDQYLEDEKAVVDAVKCHKLDFRPWLSKGFG